MTVIPLGRKETMSLFDDPADIACPMCGTTDPLEIIYGSPSTEMMEARAAGFIELGGLMVGPDAPAYHCRNSGCGNSFGSV